MHGSLDLQNNIIWRVITNHSGDATGSSVTEKIESVLFLTLYHTGSEADFGIFLFFFAITLVDLDITDVAHHLILM